MDFEIKKWGSDLDEEGLSEPGSMATYGETRRAAAFHLTEIRLFDKLEYFSAAQDETAELPRFRRIACYAVPGEMEGHDVHVEIIDHEGRRHPILSGKTFFGYFLACEIAGELARFLYQDNS